MNTEERAYLDLLTKIINLGDERLDRTGVGTYSLFGSQLRFSLENNQIPMLTTKKMFSKGVIEELLFFLRGDTDTKILEEAGVNIWKGNTTRDFLDKRGLAYLPEGDMGKGYGFQWRNFGGQTYNNSSPHFWKIMSSPPGTDQLLELIDGLQKDPFGRRHIITAWNPNQLDEMALPPCHILVQFYVSSDNKLSSQFYMRSVDSFLGLPFNILSYAILTRIVAQTVGMEAKEIVFVGGDTHVYKNHLQQVVTQIGRNPHEFPTLTINANLSGGNIDEKIQAIENLKLENFVIEGYRSHPAIKAEMAI
jgi:thymidylate synthase